MRFFDGLRLSVAAVFLLLVVSSCTPPPPPPTPAQITSQERLNQNASPPSGEVARVRAIPGYGLRQRIRSYGAIVIARGQICRIILPHALFFSPVDNQQIRANKIQALNEIAFLLKHYYRHSPVQVIGYTDRSGTVSTQKARSKAAAQVVYGYLWHAGVSRQRMRLIAAGSAKPIASDSTFAGWADNRRVEIRAGLPR